MFGLIKYGLVKYNQKSRWLIWNGEITFILSYDEFIALSTRMMTRSIHSGSKPTGPIQNNCKYWILDQKEETKLPISNVTIPLDNNPSNLWCNCTLSGWHNINISPSSQIVKHFHNIRTNRTKMFKSVQNYDLCLISFKSNETWDLILVTVRPYTQEK